MKLWWSGPLSLAARLRAANADTGGSEHHARAFSCWLASAGVKEGMVLCETDEYGMKVTILN